MAGANRDASRTNAAKFSYIDDLTIAAGVHLYQGEMVSIRFSDDAVIASTDVAGQACLGIVTQEINNSVSGETCKFISTAIHTMDNSESAPCYNDNIGQACYVEDAATVSLSGDTASIVAGRIVQVNSDGVQVDYDPSVKE